MIKIQFQNCFAACICFFLLITNFNAASQTTTPINYGIWQSTSEKINVVYYEINGRLANFNWKDIEPEPGFWDWESFDSTFTDLADDGVPFVFMIYTKEDAPDWLFANGVPKVIVRDPSGNVNGYAPYYIDEEYNFYF